MSQSARKTLDLLAAITHAEEPPGLMALSAETAVDKSTASRLLGLLEEMALVRRDPGTRRYDVGPALITLSSAVLRRMDARQAVQAALEHVRDLTGETVSLHIRVGDQRVCIYGVESHHVMRRIMRVGEAKSLARGSTGRVLLAAAPVAEARELLRPHAADPGDLDRQIARLGQIREQGFEVADSTTTPGVTAVCVPVHVGNHRVAALVASGPTTRFPTDRARRFVDDLKATAEHLEVVLDEESMERWRVPR